MLSYSARFRRWSVTRPGSSVAGSTFAQVAGGVVGDGDGEPDGEGDALGDGDGPPCGPRIDAEGPSMAALHPNSEDATIADDEIATPTAATRRCGIEGGLPVDTRAAMGTTLLDLAPA